MYSAECQPLPNQTHGPFTRRCGSLPKSSWTGWAASRRKVRQVTKAKNCRQEIVEARGVAHVPATVGTRNCRRGRRTRAVLQERHAASRERERPQYPLLLDTSLLTVGASVRNCSNASRSVRSGYRCRAVAATAMSALRRAPSRLSLPHPQEHRVVHGSSDAHSFALRDALLCGFREQRIEIVERPRQRRSRSGTTWRNVFTKEDRKIRSVSGTMFPDAGLARWRGIKTSVVRAPPVSARFYRENWPTVILVPPTTLSSARVSCVGSGNAPPRSG